MLWIADNYVKVWKIENKGNYFMGTCSSGTKKQDGTYENSSWNVKFVGKGAVGAEDIIEGSRLKLTSGGVKSIYNKDTKKTWVDVIVFKWEFVEDKQSEPVVVEEGDDELPF